MAKKSTKTNKAIQIPTFTNQSLAALLRKNFERTDIEGQSLDYWSDLIHNDSEIEIEGIKFVCVDTILVGRAIILMILKEPKLVDKVTEMVPKISYKKI